MAKQEGRGMIRRGGAAIGPGDGRGIVTADQELLVRHGVVVRAMVAAWTMTAASSRSEFVTVPRGLSKVIRLRWIDRGKGARQT